ncbi:hypothetical protein LTR53_010921, partial [Teratosphaeriaceae sp. CCFEE 6253]
MGIPDWAEYVFGCPATLVAVIWLCDRIFRSGPSDREVHQVRLRAVDLAKLQLGVEEARLAVERDAVEMRRQQLAVGKKRLA